MSQEDSLSSPNRLNRQQEKNELASLNDRFLAYKEKNRSLTERISQLQYEIEQVNTRVGREADEVKKLYEKELNDARRLIDETAKEKARQQLSASKYAARVKELEAELGELKEELNATKGRLAVADRNAASCEAQKKALLQDKADLQKLVKDLEAERDELRGNIQDLRAALESETLQKVDYQNHVQSLKEKLEFAEKVHNEEVETIRSNYKLVPYADAYEPSSIDIDIDELREHRDLQIDELKERYEKAHKDKVDKLEKESARHSDVIDQLRSEVYSLNRNLNEKTGNVTKLQEKIDKLEALLETKEAELKSLRQHHANERSKLAEELRQLRSSYKDKLKEYEELFDLKVGLDQEIATYRALLEEEETRLKLSPTPRKRTSSYMSRDDPSSSAAKRSRLERSPGSSVKQQSKVKAALAASAPPAPAPSSSVSSSAVGCVQIADVDPEGRFVTIKNLSTATEMVGGFKIVHEVDGEKEAVFKFHQRSKLQGNTSVTVWAAGARGATHSPPQQIIWKSQSTWGAGGKTVTKLLNKDNEVVATFSHACESVDVGPTDANLSFPRLSEEAGSTGGDRSQSTSFSTSTTRRGTEHVFHQQGDPPQRNADSSCVVS